MQISGRRLWLVLVLLTLVLRAPTLWVEVLDTDEAGHAVHSMVWLDGGTPYVDFIDNKQPALYATYAGIFAVLGRNLIAVHAVTLAWLLLTAWLLQRLARKVWRGDEWAAVAAPLLFLLGSSAYLEKDLLASNTEIWMNLPLAAAALLVIPLRRREGVRGPSDASAPGDWWHVAAAGGLVGVATLYNLKGAILLPVLGLVLLARHRLVGGTLRSLVLGLAAVLPWGLVAVYFQRRGALDALIFWNFLLNFKYADAGVPLWIFDLRRGILYGFPRLLLFLLATGVMWGAAAWALLRPPADGRSRAASRWVGLWALFSFAPVCVGGRFYGHYFIQLLPPLALLAAGPLGRALLAALPGFGRALRARPAATGSDGDSAGTPPAGPAATTSPWRPLRGVRLVLVAVGLLLPVVGLTVAGWVRIAQGRLDGLRPEVGHVARWIDDHSCPEDRLFVWGYWSQLYYYARRSPATRFVYPQTLAGYVPGNPASLDPRTDTSYYIVPEHWEQLFADLAAHPPELFVDVAPGAIHFWEKYPLSRFPRLQALVRAEYRQEAVVDGVVIYRRIAGRGVRRCRS